MARKTVQQQLDDKLKELRGNLGSEEDKLELLEATISSGKFAEEELAVYEEKIAAQRYIVKQLQEEIDDVKNDRAELDSSKTAADTYKWKEIEPLLAAAIERNHISYNVETNKYSYCMDLGNGSGTINPVFRSFDGSRATTMVSKLIDRYIFDANIQIQKHFITKNKTHFVETASFLYAKWCTDKVYNKAQIISKFWLEPVFNEAYNSDFDLLMYCIGGGKQENIDHLEQWIAYKFMWPERVADTPNLDIGGKPGGNGKGRYGELCRTIFTPSCIVPAAAKELNDGFNASWEMAAILLFDEPTEKELPANKMKQATGGEEQRVEKKGVDSYTADRNYSMLALSNNAHGVFKLSGTGPGGEDRRYSVIATDVVMIDEIIAREGCTEEQAGVRANNIAKLVKNREEVAKWLGAMIVKHDIVNMKKLYPLHGIDFARRFDDQKSSTDAVFDQLLPVFQQTQVINVRIIQDIMSVVLGDKFSPAPKTIKRLWKEFLSRNKIKYTEHAQDRVSIVMSKLNIETQQSYSFKLDPLANTFDWALVATKPMGPTTTLKDMLIQI